MLEKAAEDGPMIRYRSILGISFALGVVLAVCCGTLAAAQTPAPLAEIANNDSLFIDGTTFQVLAGRARGDMAKKIDELGARELGPGAPIFRSGRKLYVVDAPILVQSRPEDQQGSTTNADDEARTNRVRIDYIPPKDPEHQKIYDLVKQRRALETLQEIFAPFRFPLDVMVRTAGCDGVANAWYDRQGRQPIISLCYEYLQEIMDRMPSGPTPAGFSPGDTLLGQFFYAAAHEFGHASFDLFDVPVFGREEDAADQFATYVMLQFGKNRARRLIGGAAYSYSAFIKDYKNKPNVTLPLLAFSSNHGSPEERFYNMLCIAYGADAELFGDVVEKEYLPQSRAKGCRYEYQVLAWAFRHEISPHIDQVMAKAVLDTTWIPQQGTRPVSKK